MLTNKQPGNFIPEIWSTKVLKSLDNKLVFGQLCNREYEGEIKRFGSEVLINSIGDVQTFDYESNTDMPAPQVLTDDQRRLVIDHQKGFNFQVDDIVSFQSNIDIQNAAIPKATYAMENTIDQDIADLYRDTPAANMFGSDSAPISLSNPSDFYPLLVDIRTMHQRRKVPYETRCIVMPPEAFGQLLKDTSRFVFPNASDMATGVLKNGRLDTVTGYMIYESNNCAEVTENGQKIYKIMAFYKETISLAVQIIEVEPYRMEKRFANAVKGLYVYGVKTVRPDTLITVSATIN